MLRKDLIIRQMEEFGKVLALLLSYKKNKDWEKFEKEMSEAFLKYTMVEGDKLIHSTGEDFVKTIGDHSVSIVQKKIMGALMFEKLDEFALKNDEQFDSLKMKCLTLYQYLADNQTENEYDLDIYYKLQFLKNL